MIRSTLARAVFGTLGGSLIAITAAYLATGSVGGWTGKRLAAFDKRITAIRRELLP